jgi:hypothetical protein
VDPVLHRRLSDMRARIDALSAGQVRRAGLVDRAVGWAMGPSAPPSLERLWALARELDRVGVHTAEDARLLRQLGLTRGRVGKLGQDLRGRAGEVVDELEDAVRRAERGLLAGRLPPGTTTALARGWPQAVRVLRVADIFTAPGAGTDAAEPALPTGVPPPRDEPPHSARVAVAEFWAHRAQRNLPDVVQRRRDLDSAHEMLLRVGSDHDRDRVRRLRMEVTDARQRVREAPPVRSFPELFRHVRKTSAREPAQAYRALRSLYERAVEAGAEEVARSAHAALGEFVGDGAALRADLEAQARPPFAPVVPVDPAQDKEQAWEDAQLLEVALALREQGLEQFELAAGCARFFDVEDALSEEVVSVEDRRARPRARRVPYPTARLDFELASGLHEVGSFVLSDPRLVLHDLASNRQLVRAYYDEAPPPAPRRMRRTAVRVYVCDASGSMHGARARFRDAVMLAELNNLRTRAAKGQPTDPLYFCFFNDAPTELVRVDSAAGAARQIRRLLTDSPARGQTDITLALLQAFESVRTARGSDPYLARATVVLVTDGEDRVDLARLREARAPVGDVEVAMSFIALGEENRDLRELVREQRAAGGRAFYVHLSDAEILLARTEFDGRVRSLWPTDLPVTPVSLERLQPHLEALERVAAGKESGLGPSEAVAFDAVFPEALAQGAARAADTRARAAVRVEDPEADRLVDILEAVAEAAALAPAEERGRESVALLLHLLELYGLPLPRYLERLSRADPRHARAVAHLRLLCGPAA